MQFFHHSEYPEADKKAWEMFIKTVYCNYDCLAQFLPCTTDNAEESRIKSTSLIKTNKCGKT